MTEKRIKKTQFSWCPHKMPLSIRDDMQILSFLLKSLVREHTPSFNLFFLSSKKSNPIFSLIFLVLYTSKNTFKIILLSRTKGLIVSPDMLSFFVCMSSFHLTTLG